MQSSEDFMRAYFSARGVEIQREIERQKPFLKIFFAPECRWLSREGSKEQSDLETIENVSESCEESQVITCRAHNIRRLRYNLKQSNNSWLIQCVETECFYCLGKANYHLC